MRKFLLILLGFVICSYTNAQNEVKEYVTLEEHITLQKEIEKLHKEVNRNNSDIMSLEKRIDVTLKADEENKKAIDSLNTVVNNFKETRISDNNTINSKIIKTNDLVNNNKLELKNNTQWGIIAAVFIILAFIVISIYIIRKLKDGNTSIDDVKKAQDALQNAQIKMQEESVKLDGKLVELIERQIENVPVKSETEPDHSLALKVADEIVRIELNLSRMDKSIKGYRPLIKAVERIKNNFVANGYEIIEMLGKPYVEGMKAVVSFTTDETLESGQKIITKVMKPQVNYKEQMIQSAQIEVSQNE